MHPLLKTAKEALKELDVRTISSNEIKLEVWDNITGSDVPPIVLFVRPNAENEEDRKAIFMCVDIGIADPWTATTVAVLLMNVAPLNVLEPIFQDPATKDVFSGAEAYKAKYKELNQALAEFEALQGGSGEDKGTLH